MSRETIIEQTPEQAIDLAKAISQIPETDVGRFPGYFFLDEGKNPVHLCKLPLQERVGSRISAALEAEEYRHSKFMYRMTTPKGGFGDISEKAMPHKEGMLINASLEPGRLAEHMASTTMYINNSFIQVNEYLDLVELAQTNPSAGVKIHGVRQQNLISGGVCLAGTIDSAVSYTVVGNQSYPIKSPSAFKKIEKGSSAMILLSVAGLDFAQEGHANELTDSQCSQLIEGMYCNLFHAAMMENRHAIVMPAIGMGVFLPFENPKRAEIVKIYLDSLVKVAREFPRLSIVFNPFQFGTEFDESYSVGGSPQNLIKTTKNINHLAQYLQENGIPAADTSSALLSPKNNHVALVNPSDAAVLCGAYDVGKFWRSTNEGGIAGEEALTILTTSGALSIAINDPKFGYSIPHQTSFRSDAKKLAFQRTKDSLSNLLKRYAENPTANKASKELAAKIEALTADNQITKSMLMIRSSLEQSQLDTLSKPDGLFSLFQRRDTTCVTLLKSCLDLIDATWGVRYGKDSIIVYPVEALQDGQYKITARAPTPQSTPGDIAGISIGGSAYQIITDRTGKQIGDIDPELQKKRTIQILQAFAPEIMEDFFGTAETPAPTTEEDDEDDTEFGLKK